MIEPPPIEYQSLSIEQILNRFQSELESDATSFMNEARRIAHYDTTLRSTQQSLSALTNDVSRLMLHQTELDATLQGVHSYQCELSTTLDTLERNVDELFASQVDVRVGDADIEREKGYEHAVDVDNRLDSIDATLRRVVNDLNAAQERVWSSLGSSGGIGGDSHDEVGKIIGVFNAHQETLACLEGKARDVESDLATIGRLLAKSG
jgi:nuclear pore complex protein Nup62